MPIKNLIEKFMPKKSTSAQAKKEGAEKKSMSAKKTVAKKVSKVKKAAPKKAAKTKKVTAKKATTKKTVSKSVKSKKVAPKKVTNKKTTKAKSKVSKKQDAPQMPIKVLDNCYMQACGPNCFWFACGYVVKDVYELHDVLGEVNDDDYNYHAMGEVNDFSTWVSDVLEEHRLADDLARADTRQDAVSVLRMYIY